MPDATKLDRIEEPFIKAQIISLAGIYRQYYDALFGQTRHTY